MTTRDHHRRGSIASPCSFMKDVTGYNEKIIKKIITKIMKNERLEKQNLCSFQELSATYQTEEIRYTQNFSCPSPLFEVVVKTKDASGIYQKTNSTNMLQNPVVTASGSALPTYVSHDTIAEPLTGPPQNNREHYIATRGILYSLPHSKKTS